MAWSVPHRVFRPAAGTWPGPRDVGAGWRALGQPWRPTHELAFNPGWVRLGWNHEGIDIEAVLVGRKQSNQARELNARTWELGDVFEFFLQVEDAAQYLELHVTPENHRLQLLWRDSGVERLRAGHASLEEFLIADPNWVQSAVMRSPGFWSMRLHVPFSCLGIATGLPAPRFRGCACRYDLSDGTPTLSSTAPLSQPDFHRRGEWSPLSLQPAPPAGAVH